MKSVFMNSWYSINDIPRKTPPWGMNDLHVNTCLVDRKWIQEEKKISVKLHIPLLNTAQWAKKCKTVQWLHTSNAEITITYL